MKEKGREGVRFEDQQGRKKRESGRNSGDETNLDESKVTDVGFEEVVEDVTDWRREKKRGGERRRVRG